MPDLLCPRHEVEAWLRQHGPLVAPCYANDLIARLEARDQALREAARRAVLKLVYREGVVDLPAWFHDATAEAIRTAPLGECPQCRAEGKEERR